MASLSRLTATHGESLGLPLDPPYSGGEAVTHVANIMFSIVAAAYLVLLHGAGAQAGPLVSTNEATRDEIQRLERRLQDNAGDVEAAVAVARLYAAAGELPWALDAILQAERVVDDRPEALLRLATSYLELGQNWQAYRRLKRSWQRCRRRNCPAGVSSKFGIFVELAEKLLEQKVDAYDKPQAARRILQEVVRHGASARSAHDSGRKVNRLKPSE